jgi:hypothetical protein
VYVADEQANKRNRCCWKTSVNYFRNMASSGIRMVVKFENVKDPQKFKEAFKECIDSTRKG